MNNHHLRRTAMSPSPSTLSAGAHGRLSQQLPARVFAPRRLIPATGAALAASLAGVLAIRAFAISGTSNTSRFTPLHPASVISLTIVGVLLASATCLWLNRTSPRPIATFRSIAVAVLPLSFIPDAAIWLSAHYPQTRAATVLPLMAMHVLVATVCIVALPRLGRANDPA
jgi:Family of unknown function (DUF6069)